MLVESHHHTKVCRSALAAGAGGSLKNSSQSWAIFPRAGRRQDLKALLSPGVIYGKAR